MCTTEIVMDNIYYFILVTILNFSGKLEQGKHTVLYRSRIYS